MQRFVNTEPRLLSFGKLDCAPGENEFSDEEVAAELDNPKFPGHKRALEGAIERGAIKVFAGPEAAVRKDIPLGPERPKSLAGYSAELAVDLVGTESDLKTLKGWLKVEQMAVKSNAARQPVVDRLRGRVNEMS